MTIRTIIVPATPRDDIQFRFGRVYQVPGAVQRVFDQCARGLIPVPYALVGVTGFVPVNAPAGPLWAEVVEARG